MGTSLRPSLARGKLQIAFIIACVMFNACIAATLATAVPVILTSTFGSSYIEASLLVAAGAVVSAIVAHFVGRFSDSGASRRNIAIVSAIAGGIGFVIMAQSESYLGFLLIFVTLIALANSLFPQFMALAFVLAPKSVPMARAFASLGWVIGPPVAGFGLSVAGYSTTFNVIACLYVLLILLVFVSVSGQQSRNVESSGAGLQSIDAKAYQTSGARDLVITLSAIHLLLAVPLIAIPLRIIELGGTETHVGLAFGIAALIEIPIIVLAGRLRVLVTSRVVFCAVGAALAGYFLLLSQAATPGQVIATSVVNGVVTGVMMGYGLVVLQNRMPDRPGYASALYTNILRLTHVAALLVAGVIAQTLSFPVLFVTAACLAGALSLGLMLAGSTTSELRRV